MTAGTGDRHRVTVRQVGQEIDVADGETILAAALGAGIAYPFGCQSGNCAACKSRLLHGDVSLLPYNEYALTEAERAQRLILACRAMPRSDCEVAWLELDETLLHPLRRLACTVSSLTRATHDIVIVRLAVDSGEPLAFRAGQYAELNFPGQPARDFSFASRPGDAELEFHVRAVAGGEVSRFVGDALRPGDPVGLHGPMGFAFLRESHRGPIVALAGGSGLAPIRSIVETALRDGLRQPIHLYFGARSQRDLYLVEDFQDLARRHENFRYDVVLSDVADAAPFRAGLLHEAFAADHDDLDGAKVYAAGPPPMVEAAAAAATALGVRPEDVHADPFYAVHELPRSDAGEPRVG